MPLAKFCFLYTWVLWIWQRKCTRMKCHPCNLRSAPCVNLVWRTEKNSTIQLRTRVPQSSIKKPHWRLHSIPLIPSVGKIIFCYISYIAFRAFRIISLLEGGQYKRMRGKSLTVSISFYSHSFNLSYITISHWNPFPKTGFRPRTWFHLWCIC